MTEGLGGLAQGLAKGFSPLPELLQQRAAREQQQGQFDKNLNATLATSGYMTDPTTGAIVPDPNSPQTKQANLALQKGQIDLTEAQKNAAALDQAAPGGGTVRSAKALTSLQKDTGEARGALAGAGLQEKSLASFDETQKASLDRVRAEAAKLGFDVESGKTLLPAQVDQIIANTVATKADVGFKGKELGLRERATVTAEKGQALAEKSQKFNELISRADIAIKSKSLDQERAKGLLDVVTRLKMSEAESQAQIARLFTEGQASGMTLESVSDAVNAARSIDGPLREMNAALGQMLLDNDPSNDATASAMIKGLDSSLRTVYSDPSNTTAVQKFTQLLTDTSSAIKNMVGIKTPIAPAKPTGKTGLQSLGESLTKPKAKVEPKPAPYVAATDPKVAKEQGDTYRQIEAAKKFASSWANNPDENGKTILDSVAGVKTPQEAVDILNQKNSGHWALGPNNEIVELPWAKDVPGANQETVDSLSGNGYAKWYAEAVKDGTVPANSSPADPSVVKKVVEKKAKERQFEMMNSRYGIGR